MSKRRDVRDELMHKAWLATAACCTALHDVGFDAEELAEVMPDAMKYLADAIIARVCGGKVPTPVYPGDAIKMGQDYAERLAASRAGAAE